MWECSACGAQLWRYFGTCPKCHAVGTVEKINSVRVWPEDFRDLPDPYIYFSPSAGGMQQWPGNVPSRITRIGVDEQLDLGLTLLLEAQA